DELLRQRHERLAQIRQLGFEPYGHAFNYTHTIPEILAEYGKKTPEELSNPVRVRVAGRIQTIRRMGKAGFLHLVQNGEKLQIYIKKDAVPETSYKLYELLDIGDIIGASGYLFRTKTGELTVHAEELFFLSKIMLAMPEKWHGLEDIETRYRQRYLDLIANPEVRKVFFTRSKVISSFRRQLDERGFLEVETPMMQPLYGAAVARPFLTHHNAPDLLRDVALDATGSTSIRYQGHSLEFAKIREFSMREAIIEFWPHAEKPTLENLKDPDWLLRHSKESTPGTALIDLFDQHVEEHLFEPTIIYEFPAEVSPLSKNKPDEPEFVERFEIYAGRMEIANAFTELNDPQEQRRRF